MIDENVNYNRYFLKLIKDFDETTTLNPNLSGVKKTQIKWHCPISY